MAFFKSVIDYKLEDAEEFEKLKNLIGGLKEIIKEAENWQRELDIIDENKSLEISTLINDILKEEFNDETQINKLKSELKTVYDNCENKLGALNDSIFKLDYDAEKKLYGFYIEQGGEKIAVHPELYETAARRNVVLKDCIAFLSALDLEVGLEAEIPVEKKGWVFQMTGDVPTNNTGWEEQETKEKVLIESNGRFNSEEEAWDALDQFLAINVRDDNFNQETNFSGGGGYTFKFVGEEYFFADHPHFYPTLKLREKARDYIYQYIRKAEVLYVDYDTAFQINCHGGLWYVELSPIIYSGTDRDAQTTFGKTLWRCWPGVANLDDVQVDLLDFMEMARELDFYLISEKGLRYEVSLLDYCDQTVAKIPQLFNTREEARQAVLERIKYARLYPFVNLNYDPLKKMATCDGIAEKKEEPNVGVQLWYFPESAEQTPIPVEGVTKVTPNSNDSNDPDMPLEEPLGAMILGVNMPKKNRLSNSESMGENRNLEAAKGDLELLKTLLKEKSNLQRTELSDCGPFSFRVANGEQILAVHPHQYFLYDELKKARKLTLNHLNKEGFHLVEHILLRPRTVSEKIYVVQILDENEEPFLVSSERFSEEPSLQQTTEFIKKVKEAANRELNKAAEEALKADGFEIDLFSEDELSVPLALGLNSYHSLKKKEAALRFIIETELRSTSINLNATRRMEGLFDQFSNYGDASEKEGPELNKEHNSKTDLSQIDPYSFWATVVLPYWPRRFQDLNYRAFFEDTIRAECPAHVTLRIAWVTPHEMEGFEKHYEAWLKELGAETNPALLSAQSKLIAILQGLTNTLPLHHLDGSFMTH